MNTQTEYLEEDEIDLRQLFLKLWSRRWLIFGFMVMGAIVFAFMAFRMAPTYRSTAMLITAGGDRSASGLMDGALSQLAGATSLASGFGSSAMDPVTAEALAVLQSRQFTEQFIIEKNLMSKFYGEKWDMVRDGGALDFLSEKPSMAKAYTYFDTKIRTVSLDKKTTLITLQIDWRDRNEAAEWANELVRRLNSEMRERAIAKSKSSVEYLERELRGTPFMATKEAINRLIETQVKLQMLANVTDEYSFRVVDKALPADEDSPIKPNRRLMIVSGLVLGALVGVIWAIVISSFFGSKDKSI